jgi:tetratricopeptide (TPR) repeat protein
LAKTLKPDKPLRDSLASHRPVTPAEEVRTLADGVQAIVEGREVIFFSILVAIVLALGGSGILWYLRSNESDLAREKLGQAYAGWREIVFPTGVPGAPPPAPAAPEVQIEKARAIEQVARDFPGTRPGAMANYLAGNAYVQAGSPDRAMPLLRAALAGFDGKDPARPFAQSALAGALEDQGKADEALKAWTALMANPSPAWKLEGLLGRGRILEGQGRKSEAQAIYATVAAEFPDQARAMGLPVVAPGSDLPGSDLKVTTRPIQVEKK